ncbi:MAG: type IV pilus modification PilV family protein [Dehalococcoidales bacterium]
MQSQKGIGLVETLIAVAILGTTVVAFLVALSVGSLTASEQNKETIAQGLAQTQMEYTKNYAFTPGASTYPILSVPATYSVTVSAVAVPGADTNIQKITVNVLKDGGSILTVSDYKVKR